MSSDSDVSDVNPEELARMMEEIDFSDDDGGGKKIGDTKASSNLLKSSIKQKTPSPGLKQKKLKFSADALEDDNDLSDLLRDNSDAKSLNKKGAKETSDDISSAKTKSVKELFGLDKKPSEVPKPSHGGAQSDLDHQTNKDQTDPPRSAMSANPRRRANNPVTFDDDDLFSALDNYRAPPSAPASKKPTSDFMDDLFGSKKSSKDPAADAPSVATAPKSKEFILDDKYKSSAGTKTSPAPKKSSLSSQLPGGGGDIRPRRRIGTSTLAEKSELDLDDKLLMGTSLMNKPAQSSPQTLAAPPQVVPPSSATVPAQKDNVPGWLQQQGSSTPGPGTQIQMADTNSRAVDQTATAAAAAAAGHEGQLRQLHALEREQQAQFQQDLEEQRRLLQVRQEEHRRALEQQRSVCQEQVKAMQDRQSVILRQQQSQAEQLMRELQSRMEADMRMRSELLRNQLRMFMEIEVQNPNEVLNIQDMLAQFKSTKTSDADGKSSSFHSEALEDMENLYRLREERLREAHAEHVQELETRIDDLRKRLRETLAEHSKEMEEEKERRRTELKEARKEARQAWEDRREETLQDQEAGMTARSVEVLLSQVSANTQDLDHLQEKVGEKLLKKPTEIMEEILKQKDAKIKGLEDKLSVAETEHAKVLDAALERSKILEKELNERQRILEERESQARKQSLGLDARIRKFQTEQEIAANRLEEEKRRIRDEKLVLRQEQKAVRSMVLEHSQNLANERARIFIQRKLERGYDEKDTDGDHDSDIDLARMTTEARVQLRGILKALEEEKANLDKVKESLTEKEDKIKDKRRILAEERDAILSAVAKLGLAEKKFETRLKEFEDFAECCTRLRSDCRSHLSECQRLTDERSEVRDELRNQLEAFERKEAGLEDKRRALVQERKRLWNTRNNLWCSQCQQQNLDRDDTVQTVAPSLVTAKRTSGDGQNQLVSNHLANLKREAKLDEEFLAREAEYLRNIARS